MTLSRSLQPLQSLHLPRLQFGEVLLAKVYTTNLVAHDIRLNVLLWFRL